MVRGRRLVVGVALACALAAALPAATTAAGSRREAALEFYGGLGSWLDIYAGDPWAHPDAVVADLARRGVTTLYLETGNYRRSEDVVRPAVLSRWIEAAHAAGLNVVAWYLPSLARPSRDARRSLAAIRFRTPSGDGFDSFALDIEASVVRNVKLRSARLLALSRRLRAAAPAGYPLGAIIPSPVGMERHPTYWPGFPYAGLAAEFDAFVPMGYFTNYVRSAKGAYDYTRGVVAAIRRESGDPSVPIHVIGGLANRASSAAVGGFARAAGDCAAAGISLYAYPQTTKAQWARLQDVVLGGGAPAADCS